MSAADRAVAGRVSRKALKRNALVELTVRVIEGVRARWRLAVAAAAGLVLILGGWLGYGAYRDRAEREASLGLGRANTQAATALSLVRGAEPASNTAAKLDEAIAALRGVAEAYRTTPSGEMAAVRIGDLLYAGGRFDDALTAYQTYLTRYPRGAFAVQARVGIGYAHEANGDWTKAATAFAAAADRSPDHPQAVDAELGLGRASEALGKTDEAIKAYTRVADRAGAGAARELAQQRLNSLRPK